MDNDEILQNLKKTVLGYDREGAVKWAKKAVAEEIDPIEGRSVEREIYSASAYTNG